MSHRFPESDWKAFRELRVVALQRFCERVLTDSTQIASDLASTPHERFLKLFAQVNDQNDELARAFDDPRRSSMLHQLAVICSHNLLEPAELARFSDATRETVESLGKSR